MQLIDLIAIIGNIAGMMASIPQIITQIKSKTRAGFSPLMPWFWVVGNVSMIIYNVVVVKNPYIIFFFSFGLLTSLIILYLYYFKSK